LKTEFALFSFGFSPDGRYLVVVEINSQLSNQSNAETILSLHDINHNETTPFLNRQLLFPPYSYGWTPDSEWFAFLLEDNRLTLVAPDEHYVQIVSHDYGYCSSMGWLSE
jgi:hypothetical protein